MATAIKRISDGKIIIECSEEEFSLLYHSVKIQQHRRYPDKDQREFAQLSELRKSLEPLHSELSPFS